MSLKVQLEKHRMSSVLGGSVITGCSNDTQACGDEDETFSDAEILSAVLQLARDIDDLTERADALGLGLPGIKLSEAAELCRQEAPEPGTR